MWPVLLDMTKEESMQNLRNLELEAYAHLVSALRAQGPLSPDKLKVLKDTGLVLNITQDRHKAEIRRAISDEKLNTIAYHVTGVTESLDDWAQEGRRTVPLIPRMAPQTAYSVVADEAAEGANQNNKQLPPPACTERKRQPIQSTQLLMPEGSKTMPFRIPELPKNEDSKKRKLPIESSSLAQHLLGPSKISRTQQMYRQRTKGLMKEHSLKLKQQPTKVPMPPHPPLPLNGPKPTFSPIPPSINEETIENIQNEINSYTKPPEQSAPGCSNENQAPRPKMVPPPAKTPPTVTFKQVTTAGPGPSGEIHKTLKLCPPRKPPKPVPLGQKLIVVSNAQTLQSSSILQKTLSVPLVKNISVKNLEKFKIVTTSSSQIISTATNNINSFKHKVVTVKTNPTTKKVIPLSQLLGAKGGIKVLPYGGKIVGKTVTSTASQPLYIVNTMGATQSKHLISQPIFTSADTSSSPNKENSKSSVLGDILKASGVTADDFDAQIEEFRIPNNNHMCKNDDNTKQDQSNGKERSYVVVSEGNYSVQSDLKSSGEQCEEVVAEEVDTSEPIVLQVQNLTNVSEAGGN